MFEAKITVGNILTSFAVLLSATSLLVAWARDRRMRHKEYADKIRQSAGLIIAKLERWMQLSLTMFDDIQVAITDVDMELVDKQDPIYVRDVFWQRVGVARAKSKGQIMAEGIEVAYADLYGYDSRIHELFVEAIQRFKTIDQAISSMMLEGTQKDILSLGSQAPYRSAQLGNVLRTSCSALEVIAGEHMSTVLRSFTEEMFRLIRASDRQIYDRSVSLRSLTSVFPREGILESLNRWKEQRASASQVPKDLTLCCTHRVILTYLYNTLRRSGQESSPAALITAAAESNDG